MVLIIGGYGCYHDYMLPYYPLSTLEIKEHGELVRFECMPVKDDYNVDDELLYYWYDNDSIYITEGRPAGYVLQGKYEVFYGNGQLKEFGNFDYGLKDGKWTIWDEMGNVVERVVWKKGKAVGSKQN